MVVYFVSPIKPEERFCQALRLSKPYMIKIVTAALTGSISTRVSCLQLYSKLKGTRDSLATRIASAAFFLIARSSVCIIISSSITIRLL